MSPIDFNKRVFVSIEVNGVRYDRLEDVPAEYQRYLEDKDGNGIPDLVESAPDSARNMIRVEKRTIHSSDLSNVDIQHLLNKRGIERSSHFVRTHDGEFNLGNIMAHLRAFLGTMIIAFILAVIMLIAFMVWIFPRLS